jgi:hypothetical protein
MNKNLGLEIIYLCPEMELSFDGIEIKIENIKNIEQYDRYREFFRALEDVKKGIYISQAKVINVCP